MSTTDQRPIRARADRKRFVPGCGACNGTGRVHVQVRGQFRVESRECQCWRVQGAPTPAAPADEGLCLRCLGTGGVDAITRGKNAGECVMCSYCGGSGRVRR